MARLVAALVAILLGNLPAIAEQPPAGAAAEAITACGWAGAVEPAPPTSASRADCGTFRRQVSDLGLGLLGRDLSESVPGWLTVAEMRAGRNPLNSQAWSLGIESAGALGWAADVFGDDRLQTWLSGGVKLPLAEKISASLAYAQPLASSGQRRWTLGLRFAIF
jgi:hypothetical protein